MRFLGLAASLLLFSCSALSADMTDEERCLTLGEVAEKASIMRISGEDKNTATSKLIKMYDKSDSGLSTDNIRGMVTLSYMARMKPIKMRDFAIDQCKKDIIR